MGCLESGESPSGNSLLLTGPAGKLEPLVAEPALTCTGNDWPREKILIVLAPICGAVSKGFLLKEPVPRATGMIFLREHAYHMILLKILWSFLWNRVILMALRALPLSSSHSLLTSCSTNCDIVILR